MESNPLIGVTTEVPLTSVRPFSGLRITGVSLLVGVLVTYTFLISFATRWQKKRTRKVVRRRTPQSRDSLLLRPDEDAATTSPLSLGPLRDIESLDSMLALALEPPPSLQRSARTGISILPCLGESEYQATAASPQASSILVCGVINKNVDTRTVQVCPDSKQGIPATTSACSIRNQGDTAEASIVDDFTRKRHTMTVSVTCRSLRR